MYDMTTVGGRTSDMGWSTTRYPVFFFFKREILHTHVMDQCTGFHSSGVFDFIGAMF
jgi:hypothetical protein